MLYVHIAYLANAREQMDPQPCDWGYVPTEPQDDEGEDERGREI